MGEMVETDLEVTTPVKIYRFGTFEPSSVVGDKITLSGYVSTVEPDLSGHVCPEGSWDEFLPFYNRNPLYCYNHWITSPGQENKDLMGEYPPYPIGRVNGVTPDSKGLHFDQIVLSDIPFVRDILGKLIQDKVLKQQSAGFLNLKKEKRNGKLYLLRNFLQEGSIVPLAANPFGTDVVLKTIDGFKDFSTVEAIIKAYNEGSLVLAQKHFVPSNYNFTEKEISSEVSSGQHNEKSMSNPLNPIFRGVAPLEHADSFYDPNGDPVAKPAKYHKNFNEVSERIHAAVSQDGENGDKTYLFQIGIPTEKGFKYDWNMVALSTAKVLGARGGAKFNSEEKLAVVKRLQEAYGALNKTFPKYFKQEEGETLADLPAWKLADVQFNEIDFAEGETDLVRKSVASTDATNLLNALKAGGLEDLEEVKALRKYISANLNISISSDLAGYDPDKNAFLIDILKQVSDYNVKYWNPVAEEEAENTPDDESMEKRLKFIKFLDGNETKYGKSRNGKVELFVRNATGLFESTSVTVDTPKDAEETINFHTYNLAKSISNSTVKELESMEQKLKPLIKPIPEEIQKALKFLDSFIHD